MSPNEGSRGPQPAAAVVPSVVAVVVTHNPGVWFDETLTSLVSQDYRNLAILVIDAGSEVDLTDRIESLAPEAYVRRLRSNPGFSTAANLAGEMVEGANFYLFCHDDVALDPGAVKAMVEEAYRSNAGLVGPKLVRWDTPDLLQAAGLQADKFGHPVPIVETDELDQEQHDAVRDVFFVPSACLLVRADLFGALGGFDEGISLHGEDTDLCWRAHLAGARVLVTPARVRHVEALAERRDDDSRRLQLRHRLRMVLSNYGLFYLAAVLLQHAVLSAVEFLGAVFTGRFRHALDVAGAYTWNLRRLPSVLAKRRRVRRVRQITDLELRRLQVRGSARAASYLRSRLAGGRPADLGRTSRQFMSAMRAGLTQGSLLALASVVLVLLFGGRHLLTQTVPAVGEFSAAPGSSLELVREWWSGWRSTGLGAAAAVPFVMALHGLLGLVALGSEAAARQIAIVGLLPLGYIGAWRLGRLLRSGRSQVVVVVAYAANPLPYSALASGSWRGLAVYAAAPWLLRRLLLAGADEPFGPATAAAGSGNGSAAGLPAAGTGGARRTLRQSAGLGVIAGLAAAVYPWAPLAVAVMALGIALGSALVGRWRGTARLALVAVGGAALGFLLHAPWWYSALRSADPDATLAGRSALGPLSLADAVHFGVGRLGASKLSWGLVVAALLALAIGRGWRLVFAARMWAVAAVCWGLVAAVRADLLTVALPPAEVLLAPAAAALAFSCGLGMVAFDRDLPGYRFGWRQVASLLALVAIVGAALSLTLRSFDGRWHLPARGWDRALSFQTEERDEVGLFRVLWLGHPQVLPAAGWPLPAAVGEGAYTTTFGAPEPRNGFAGPDHSAAVLAGALESAAKGDTTRMGRLLAPASIRYVIVVDELAPEPDPGFAAAADPALVELLTSQLDLEEVDTNGAIRVFRNAAWAPYAAAIPEPVDAAGLAADQFDDPGIGEALRVDSPRSGQGTLADGPVVHVAESRSDRWRLEVDGGAAEQVVAGWATQFRVVGGGDAELSVAPSGRRLAGNVVQVVAWLAALVVAVYQPSGSQARTLRDLAADAGPKVLTRPLVVDDGGSSPAVSGAAATSPLAKVTAAGSAAVAVASGDGSTGGRGDGDLDLDGPDLDTANAADGWLAATLDDHDAEDAPVDDARSDPPPETAVGGHVNGSLPVTSNGAAAPSGADDPDGWAEVDLGGFAERLGEFTGGGREAPGPDDDLDPAVDLDPVADVARTGDVDRDGEVDHAGDHDGRLDGAGEFDPIGDRDQAGHLDRAGEFHPTAGLDRAGGPDAAGDDDGPGESGASEGEHASGGSEAGR